MALELAKQSFDFRNQFLRLTVWWLLAAVWVALIERGIRIEKPGFFEKAGF